MTPGMSAGNAQEEQRLLSTDPPQTATSRNRWPAAPGVRHPLFAQAIHLLLNHWPLTPDPEFAFALTCVSASAVPVDLVIGPHFTSLKGLSS